MIMRNKFDCIELFYFDQCPSWKETLRYLEEITNELDINNEINSINVETNEDAKKYKFAVSPTIKVNGEDIFPDKQSNYALECRIYKTTRGFKGSPTKEMILVKLSNRANSLNITLT